MRFFLLSFFLALALGEVEQFVHLLVVDEVGSVATAVTGFGPFVSHPPSFCSSVWVLLSVPHTGCIAAGR